MPDVFDQVADEAAPAKGDVFDQVAVEKHDDVFDQVARTPVIRPAPINPNAPGGFNSGGTATKIAPDTALGEDFWHDLYADASRPAVPLPKFEVHPDDSRPAAVAKSLANLVISLPEFVESPLGVASVASGTVLPRTVAAAFLGTTGKQLTDQSKQMGSEWDELTPAQKAAALTDIGGQTVLAGLLAHGAGGKLADAVDTRVNPAGMLARELNRTEPKFNGETPPTPLAVAAPPRDIFDQVAEPVQTPERAAEPFAAPPEPLPQTPPATPPQAEVATPAPSPEPAALSPSLVPVDVPAAQIKAMRGSVTTEAPPDILSTIEDHYPKGVKFDAADHGEAVSQAQGAAKELMSHTSGEPADVVLDSLHLNGQFHGLENVDDLANAMVSAGKQRISGRNAVTAQARQLAEEQARTQLFEATALKPRKAAEPIPVEQLFLGDTFKVNGQPMRVVDHPIEAETGRPYGVELEGAYGRQHVSVGQIVHIDTGTLKGLLPDGRVAASGNSAPRATKNVIQAIGFQTREIGPLRKSAGQFLATLKGKSFINEDTGVPLLMDNKSIREPISGQRTPENLNVLSALPQMIRRAVHNRTAPDAAGRPDIKAWHYYKVPVELAGEIHEVTLVARELKDGRRFYDSYILESKRPTTKSGTTSETLGDPQAAGPSQTTPNLPNVNTSGRLESAGGSAPRPPRPPRPVPAPLPVPRTPAPPVAPVKTWLSGFKSIFAPHRIDSGAGTVANILRDVNGEKANNLSRADEAMHQWRKEFDTTPVPKGYTYDPAAPLPHNFAIIDAMEGNRAALPARYQPLVNYFDQAFAARIAEIQKFAPQALQKLITDYFPHIWEDPKRAAGVMQQVATKLFAGKKEFLKQRSLPMFKDGLERGLKPISDNPVDLLLAKMHSMDKFIAALKAQTEFKAIGKLKFKYALEKMPDGWRAIDDPAFTVHAPPVVTIKEAFDAQLRTRTLELLQKLGVPESRLATLGGKRWGLAYESPEQIKTRFGGPMSVYFHELGHILDFRYNLQNTFLKQGKLFDQEVRALADRRLPEGYVKSRAVRSRTTGKVVNRPTSMVNYVRKAEEKMAVMLEAYVHAPEVFQRIAPTVYRQFDKFITDHPELHDVRDLKPSLRLGTAEMEQKLPGSLKLGDWIMPDGPAQVLKNYLSPGLSHSGVYRSVRAASNLLNAAQLGLSAFHVGFTSLDAVVNAVEVGMFRALHGDMKGGMATLSKAPIAPVANYMVGKAVQRAMLDPQATHIRMLGIKVPISPAAHDYAALAVKGGLRATIDPFWQTHMTRNLVRAAHEGGLAWAKTPLYAPMALVEQLMRPISEYLVPRQKLGVFALLAKAEMDRLPAGADVHQVRAAMAKAADATEDRMGQMTYDNLFYNRVAKDLALLSFRAYGWQLGKYRHFGGAISDTVTSGRQLASGKLPELTHRQLYFVALPLVVGAIGGVLHKLFTGQDPQNVMDYLHPATGQLDANGNAKRLSLPSYLKDLESDEAGLTKGFKTGGVLGAGQGVWTAAYHRLNPGLSIVVDMLNNRDFYGTQIWNPDDNHLQQLGSQAAFIAKSMTPFSITGAMKLSEGQASTRDKVMPFIGIVPAKREITMTPLESYYGEQFRNLVGDRLKTKEQGEQQQLKSKLVTDLRTATAGGPAVDNLPARLLAAGVKNQQALNRLGEKAELLPIQYQAKYLPLLVAMRGFDLASDEEKAKLATILVDKINRADDAGLLDEQSGMRWAKLLLPYYKPEKPNRD